MTDRSGATPVSAPVRVAASAARPLGVTIAIASFRRPEGLARALGGVARLERAEGWAIDVLVVDNSPEGAARDQVAALAEDYPLPLHYAHETARGISCARNRALDEALRAKKDFLAFLDDDEEPSRGWLAAMLATAEASGAAAIVGPVAGRFEQPPARWARRGRFFDIPGGEDGAAIEQNTAGNSMLRLAAIERLGLRFDPAFGLSGGEDTMFFTALRRGGEETVFSAGAMVIEDISPRRARLSWLMTRWYRTGITPVSVAMALGGGSKARLKAALGGLARLGLGGLGAIAASPLALLGKPTPYRALRVACRGAGLIAGALNMAFEEYRSDRK